MKRTLTLLSVFALLLSTMVLPAAASTYVPPLGEAHTGPGGNCFDVISIDGETYTGTKLDSSPRGEFQLADGVSITVTENSVTASGGTAILCIKGGDTNSGTVVIAADETFDYTTAGISNIVWYRVIPDDVPFVPEGLLAVEKTAAGSYDRTVRWELAKDVDQPTLSGAAGELFTPVTWTVTATKSATLDNYQVEGEIEISNGFNAPVTVTSITDSIAGTSITCDAGTVPFTLQPLAATICSYSADVADDTITSNSVDVVGYYTIPEGFADAGTEVPLSADDTFSPILYTESLVGYDSGVLTDARFTFEETIDDTTVEEFLETFECSDDASRYEDGQYMETVTNIATLNGNLGLEASASVEVVCTLPALEVAKTAEGSFDRTVTWDLDKLVDVDSHSGVAGDTFTSIWRVTATKSEAIDNYLVAGTITVTNPAAIDQDFTLSDVLAGATEDDITTLVVCPDDNTLGVGSFTVGAGESITCTYEAPIAGAELNTVTVTADGNAPIEATATVGYVENLVGFDQGTLSDPRFGFEEGIDASTEETFEEDFACSTDREDFGDDFRYTEEFVNEAFLNGNLNLEASATVRIECEWGIGETATGEGPEWREVVRRTPNNWFMISLTDDLLEEGGVRLIAGQHYHIGQLELVGEYLEFELFDGAYLDAVGGNVKIQPLDEVPTRYLSPGQYEIQETVDTSLTEFSIPVSYAEYGYAIHLDVRRSLDLPMME